MKTFTIQLVLLWGNKSRSDFDSNKDEILVITRSLVEDKPLEPLFDTSPINITVVVGDTAILPCTAQQKGFNKIIWLNPERTLVSQDDSRYMDDIRISIQRPTMDDWNLRIKEARYNDSGDYWCQINTRRVKIKMVYLFVKVPPEISGEKNNVVKIEEGTTLELVCSVTGEPMPEVTWYKQSKLFNASEYEITEDLELIGEVLLLHNVSSDCDGIYECYAENGVLPKASRRFEVTVISGAVAEEDTPIPTLDTSPSNITAVTGETVTLPCAVKRKGFLAISWLSPDGTLVSQDASRYIDDTRMSIQRPTMDDWNLRIMEVQYNDSGEYICQLNTRPVQNKTVYLSVEEGLESKCRHGRSRPPRTSMSSGGTMEEKPLTPSLETSPSNITAVTGETVILPCTVELNDYTLVWLNPQRELLFSNDRLLIDDYRMRMERPTTKDWNLRIRDIKYKDRGEYMCQINTSPIQIKRVYLSVKDAVMGEEKHLTPLLDTSPSNITAVAGQTVILPCTVELNDYILIWINPKSVMISSNDRRLIDDFRITVKRPTKKDWNLIIRDIKYKDSGKYTCQINTSPIQTKIVNLSVKDGAMVEEKPLTPLLDVSPSNITAVTGETVILPCTVEPNDYTLVWLNPQRELLFSNDRLLIDDYRMRMERPTTKDWNLRIRDIKYEDRGEYMCQINTSPIQIKRVYLSVKEIRKVKKPQKPQTTVAAFPSFPLPLTTRQKYENGHHKNGEDGEKFDSVYNDDNSKATSLSSSICDVLIVVTFSCVYVLCHIM